MSADRETHLETRRAEILDAARRVFVRQGFEAATMQDIASAADLSAGSLYNYFPGKDDLIRAVCMDCEDETRELFSAATTQDRSPYEALYAIGERIWRELDTSEGRERATLHLESSLVAARSPEAADVVRQSAHGTIEALTSVVTAAQERDELSRDLDATGLATLLVAVTGGMEKLSIQLGDDVDAERVWDVLVRLLGGRRIGTQEDD